MVARKKACLLSEEININAIESKIAALDGASPAETAALRKDAHLLAGAVQTDKLIVTADLRLATLTAKYLPELGIEFLCIDPSANEGARNKVLERLAELAHS